MMYCGRVRDVMYYGRVRDVMYYGRVRTRHGLGGGCRNMMDSIWGPSDSCGHTNTSP